MTWNSGSRRGMPEPAERRARRQDCSPPPSGRRLQASPLSGTALWSQDARAGRSRAGRARRLTGPLAQRRRARETGEGATAEGDAPRCRRAGVPLLSALRVGAAASAPRLYEIGANVRCELGAAQRQPGNPMRACFYFGGLTVAAFCWALGSLGQICNVYIYVFMYLYMYLCLFPKSWVFRGIQGNTPSAATAHTFPLPPQCLSSLSHSFSSSKNRRVPFSLSSIGDLELLSILS